MSDLVEWKSCREMVTVRVPAGLPKLDIDQRTMKGHWRWRVADVDFYITTARHHFGNKVPCPSHLLPEEACRSCGSAEVVENYRGEPVCDGCKASLIVAGLDVEVRRRAPVYEEGP